MLLIIQLINRIRVKYMKSSDLLLWFIIVYFIIQIYVDNLNSFIRIFTFQNSTYDIKYREINISRSLQLFENPKVDKEG